MELTLRDRLDKWAQEISDAYLDTDILISDMDELERIVRDWTATKEFIDPESPQGLTMTDDQLYRHNRAENNKPHINFYKQLGIDHRYSDGPVMSYVFSTLLEPLSEPELYPDTRRVDWRKWVKGLSNAVEQEGMKLIGRDEPQDPLLYDEGMYGGNVDDAREYGDVAGRNALRAELRDKLK